MNNLELTEHETDLIKKLRRAKASSHHKEHVILVRYIPTDMEGNFTQQVLLGSPQSILQMRLAMKELLDDLQALELKNSFFSITYEPHGLSLFKH